MTLSHVITASDKSFILWHYRTPRSQTTLDIAGIRTKGKNNCKPNNFRILNFLGLKRENKEKIYTIETFLSGEHSLCSVTARDNVLIFGTDSRHLVGFNLSSSGVQFVGDIQLSFEPVKISLNSNSTYVTLYRIHANIF